MSNNVIDLPKSNVVPFPSRKRDDEEIISIVEEIVSEMIAHANSYDVKFYEARDLGLIAESLVSAIKRTRGIHHPLQDLAETFVHVVD